MQVPAIGRVLGVVLALGILPLASCKQESTVVATIGRQDYIDIYVEILRAAGEAPDSVAASDSARAILARHGVSEQDLLDFARHHVDDTEYLVELWSEIEQRLRNPEESDSARTNEPELDDPPSDFEE